MNRGPVLDVRPLDRSTLDDHPLPPVQDGDKDSKGRILIVAGSSDVPGAALLCATAAMRSGAGKLTIATVESVATSIGVAMPEAMVIGLPEAEDGGFGEGAAERLSEEMEADCVVAGPGVARGDSLGRICRLLLTDAPRLALDAAFLHCLASIGGPPGRDQLPILLPHSGELASMLDSSEVDVESDPVGSGLAAAKRYRAIVLAKGVESHVVTPDDGCWRYDGGAPGLGVSGSGDVLAGIVGGLLSRGADPLAALLWAVWLHGEAGSSLSRKVGPIGFLAREIADEIPALLAG